MKIKLDAYTLILATACIFTALGTAGAQSPSPSSGKKPNILVIYRPRKEILDGTWKFPEAHPQ